MCKSDIDFHKPIDKDGTTFMYKAAECVHGCIIMINYSSRLIDVNSYKSHGATTLHVAALFNRETCTMLLKYGADVIVLQMPDLLLCRKQPCMLLQGLKVTL